MYFLQFFKAKNVRHEPRAVLLNNASPSDLPVNCSWFSTLLGIPESTSLNNCCKWLHIFMRARAHAEAQHRRVWTRCQIMRHALMLLTFFFFFPFLQLWGLVLDCWFLSMFDQKALFFTTVCWSNSSWVNACLSLSCLSSKPLWFFQMELTYNCSLILLHYTF